MNAPLTTRIDGDVLEIQLDDGKANVLGTPMLTALAQALDASRDAGAVLLFGREKTFCGGLDLNEVLGLSPESLARFLDLFHATFRALFTLERPLVIAARGGAVAGGAILLCCGDVRLGARDQGLCGVNESRLGLVFPASALEIVRFALNPAQASRALVLGELFDKEQALTMGFFHDLHAAEHLMDVARARARDAAQVSPTAAGMIKAELRREGLRRMDEQHAGLRDAFAAAWTGSDAQARLRQALASLKKR